ncbi:MAG: hypothetical protein ABIT38_04050 [Gemmatimonadaceae bacterium]
MHRSISRRLRRTVLLVGSLVAPLACGGGGGDEGPTGITGSITISATPTTLSVHKGGTGTVSVALARAGGFTGTVSVAITGLPAGITTTITPTQITGSTTSATVDVAVATSVAVGQYSATVTASGTGVTTVAAQYTISVTAPPSYTIALTPNAISLAQSSSGTVVVAIGRTNFAGVVNLALTGAPAGITGTFNPAAATTDASTLTLSIASTVTPGAYPVTVTGIATAMTDKTVPLTITVTAAAGYTMSLTPATVNVAPGATASSAIVLTRNGGFVGGVTLSVESPPVGITATFNPTSVVGDQSTMTVSVAASVTPGNYTLTVKGTATGVPDRTAQLTVVVAAPAFTITPAPNALTVQQGASATSTVTIGRSNFSGNVTMSLDTPPPGVTGSFAPGTTAGNTATFTVNVAGNTAPGNYVLTLRGTSNGIADKTATINLTVTSAPGSISIALAPNAVTIQQGTSGQTTVNLTRTNFAGDVTFVASGGPAGVAVAFSPTTTTASTSTATLTVTQGQATGNFPITISASGTGVASATASLAVTVTSPVQGSNSVWQFCSAADAPSFFAYQDGTGAWQRVLPAVSGTTTTFSFSLTQNRGGVIYVRPQGSAVIVSDAASVASHSRIRQAQAMLDAGRAQQRQSLTRRGASSFRRASSLANWETEVVYGTSNELTTLGTDNCTDTRPTKTINATVAGVAAGETAQLSLGGASAFVTGGQTAAVQFQGVPFGTVDLVGTRAPLGDVPDKVVLQRNLNIPDGGALPATIDFNSAQAFAPAMAIATVTNSLGDDLFLSSLFFTANGEAGFFAREQLFDTNVQRTWSGVPNNRLANGDLHGIFLFASPDFTAQTTQRLLLQFTTSVANQTSPLGPNLDIPTATPLSVGSNPRFRFQGSLPLEYRSALNISIQDAVISANQYSISVTSGYLSIAGSNSVFDVVMPDVGSLNGFPAGSGLLPGANQVQVQASGWNGGGLLTLRPRSGDVLRAGIRVVNINVP